MTDLHTLWSERLPVELRYWDMWLATHGAGWADDPVAAAAEFRARFDPNTPLQENIVELIAVGVRFMPTVRILDVGAGPATALGSQWPGVDLQITAVDPLGAQYASKLVDYALAPPVITLPYAGEDIMKHFAADTFDLAYARNCLDHAADPLLIIKNMYDVVKPGGCVYLLHHDHEAGRRSGEGLHQWDFFRDGDEYAMVRYTAGEPRTTHRLSLGASMTMRAVPPYDTEVVIRKPL